MEYFTLITSIGASKIALATANNTTLALTHIAVGDGAGNIAMPDASRTALVNETYRASLTDLTVDENNTNWVVAVGYIPSNEGNFWVREVGIFDVDGDLIAIGNYPETFKPVTADGVAKDLYMKVIFEVSSLESITLQVDPSLVMASREYVNNGLGNKSEKTHKHNWSEIEQKPITFPPSSHSHDSVYAKLGGLATQGFKVKDAVADDEAINKKQLNDALGALVTVPTGFIIANPSMTIPAGFLECNGASLSKTTYANLFAKIGTTYGSTSTTFKLPDLRGEFIRGWDHGRGVDSGRSIGSMQIDQLKSHTHNLASGSTYGGSGSWYLYSGSGSPVGGYSGLVLSSGGNETRPRNIAMMYCIKY